MRATKIFGDCFFINPGARLAHYMSPVNRALLEGRYRRKLREYVVFFKKHGIGSAQWASLLWLLTGLWVEAIRSALRARNMDPLTGYFQGVRDGFRWEVHNEDAQR
jgi:hypothetical protein